MNKLFLIICTVIAIALHSFTAVASPINLALNTSRTGFPNPLGSDPGWGGGSDQWSIVDGLRSYSSWANGLAFQYGGQRQATIDFGAAVEFDNLVLWWHGVDYTPTQVYLSYWDGSINDWVSIDNFTRVYGVYHEEGSGSGYSDSDEYSFSDVTSSQVRVSFQNTGLAISGNPMVHGWLYEFEVYNNFSNPIPEPSPLALLLTGLLSVVGIRRKVHSLL